MIAHTAWLGLDYHSLPPFVDCTFSQRQRTDSVLIPWRSTADWRSNQDKAFAIWLSCRKVLH